jgi:hypothetical protein
MSPMLVMIVPGFGNLLIATVIAPSRLLWPVRGSIGTGSGLLD